MSIAYNNTMPKEEILLKLGHIIKYARNKKGLTQDQLAELSNVSKGTIASLECGTANLRFMNLYQLAKTLDIDMGVLNNFQL